MSSQNTPTSEMPRLPVRVPLGTKPLRFWGALQAARRNLLLLIPEIAVKQPIVSGKTGARWHMVMDPVALRRVFLDNLDNYPKSLVTKNMLKPAIGESMFIAEGAHWRWQRRAAAPVFSPRNISNLSPIMSAAAERCVARMRDTVQEAGAQPVNVVDEMVSVTFDVISDVTFSGDSSLDRDEVHKAINAFAAEAARMSVFDFLALPDWVPRPRRTFFAGGVAEMRKMADQAIAERDRRPKAEVADLMDLLQAGDDPKTGRRMSPAELRDNLLTFIVAGHETTALALSWSLYLLAFDPKAQQRARDEIQSVLSGKTATGADVEKLPFTRSVIDEAMRFVSARRHVGAYRSRHG